VRGGGGMPHRIITSSLSPLPASRMTGAGRHTPIARRGHGKPPQ